MKRRNSDSPTLKTHYKRYCRILSKVIIIAKRLYYNNLILNTDDKQKTTWNIIKKLEIIQKPYTLIDL